MKDFKNKKQQGIAQHSNSKQLPPPLRGRAEFLCERSELRNSGGGYTPSTRKAAFTLAEGGRRPLLNSGYRRAAFTLAEVLITLAVIGIVAVLTIPALVKNHQERAWSTAQDVFTKKFEVAMKTMANNSTVSGYDSTESFVNELKKYIKITNVCTDDVTKCFAPKVVWAKDTEAIDVTNNAVKYNENGDWAETVGIQFANGVNALISYNKQCYVDPYNNQEAIMAKCVGIIYDVSGFKTPNTNRKDILANGNVIALSGDAGCAYKLSDGTCFTKILAPGTGYSALSTADCTTAKEKKKINVDYCYNDTYGGADYYAGAVLACGGKKTNLPTMAQLGQLATELYNYSSTIGEKQDVPNINLDKDKATSFLTQSPGGTMSYPWFFIYSNEELNPSYALGRNFYDNNTLYNNAYRHNNGILAVCVDN